MTICPQFCPHSINNVDRIEEPPAFEMLAFFRFIKFYNEGEITMVSVRKHEYRFEIVTVEGTRKWITKSGYPTKAFEQNIYNS